uniref:Sex-Peptide n=1 Tax=Drosophila subobscura TaxID=7241 RepID=O62540_DROSU|nr:Sex-Peptide [Drosophila subobscura]CAA12368.1 Sex-Peptide [Drosophila subobscura]CAA12370.1 Sex-Peptide [Drosophila subobscura]CAA12372.1 Sex-Peptide [Drosophila subobscura]CAA12374.1 Sex-peptide [Drosophila subobscura]
MRVPISLMLFLLLLGVACGVHWRITRRTTTSSTWGPRDIQKWCRLNFGPAWGGRGC